MIVVTDLEGVLIPEIWVEISRVTGIDELSATTHEEPDFGRLMDRRIEILTEHDLRLPALQRIAADLIPYPGATEFLAWARTKGQVMIASDTFHELSENIVQRMGGYSLFANRFRVDEDGRILGYRLRIRGRKDNVVRSLKEIGFHIVAVGDGFNDELMLRIADDPVLYRAPEELARRIPESHRAVTLEDLRRIILDVHTRLERAAVELVK
jgi:phosphoserine/homoserine phosphotransferase